MDGCGVGWAVREAQSRRPYRRHSPRPGYAKASPGIAVLGRRSFSVGGKRGIQYAAASPYPTTVSGILDHPPSRVMTAVWVAGLCHMLTTSVHATNMHK
jgi:hypothetical protein